MNTTTSLPITHASDLLSEIHSDLDSLMTPLRPAGSGFSQSWQPRSNLCETEQAYELSVDLPGLKPEDISIEMKNGDLWISGERQPPARDTGRTWHRVETHYGSFRRVFRFGDGVDPDSVDAEYRDGVLFITVPRSKAARPQHIQIKS